MNIKEVAFHKQAPDLRRISDQISALTGLAVSVTESSAEEKGGHHDLHAHLAYECAPEARLEIYTEPAQPQVICLQWISGQLPVLLFATIGALEELGGVSREPLSERERREYVRKLTAGEIEEYRRRLRNLHRLSFLLNLLVLPLTVPYWVVRLILIGPRKIRSSWEAARSFHRRHT